MNQDCEQKLAQLRQRFAEKERAASETDVFTPLSKADKQQKVADLIKDCQLKIELLHKQETTQPENRDTIAKSIALLQEKEALLREKMDFINSGETDDARREKLKRTLLELELKRAKLRFADKDCSKIDEKIRQKLALFTKDKQF